MSGKWVLTAFWPGTFLSVMEGWIWQRTVEMHLWVLRPHVGSQKDPLKTQILLPFRVTVMEEGRGSVPREKGLYGHTLSAKRNLEDEAYLSSASLRQPCWEFYRVPAQFWMLTFSNVHAPHIYCEFRDFVVYWIFQSLRFSHPDHKW